LARVIIEEIRHRVSVRGKIWDIVHRNFLKWFVHKERLPYKAYQSYVEVKDL